MESPKVTLSILRWFISVLIAIPCLTIISFVGVFSRRRAWSYFAMWSKLQCKIFGIQLRVIDRNGSLYLDCPYVFVQLNQTSLLEIIYWPNFLPVSSRFIENIEFALIPFLGWASMAIGGIPIIRQWAPQSFRGLALAERALKQKSNISISIEGKRSRDGSLNPFKKGPVVMAISSKATIIPVIFKGARERLAYGEWRPRPGLVEVTLCKAISTEGMTYNDRSVLVSQLRSIAEKEIYSADS
jgi:1-acyl-sn-glycerol-3-phosphate acyltransferase